MELDFLNMKKIQKIKEYNPTNLILNNDLIYYKEKTFYTRWVWNNMNGYKRFGIRLSFTLKK